MRHLYVTSVYIRHNFRRFKMKFGSLRRQQSGTASARIRIRPSRSPASTERIQNIHQSYDIIFYIIDCYSYKYRVDKRYDVIY